MVGRDNLYIVVFEDNRFIVDAMEVIPRENIITISIRNPLGLAVRHIARHS